MDADQAVTAHFVAEPTPGVVTQDGAYSTANGDEVGSISFAHTLGTGADRLLMVGVSWNSLSTATTISSVTFTPDGGGDAESLTPVITQQPSGQMRYSAIYSLLPDASLASGATGTVTVTFSASISNGIVAGAVNFQGVDQTTPLGTAVGAASTNNTTQLPLVALTGLSGDELVFDNVFMGGTDSGQTIAPVSDQTELWNAFNPNTRGSASFEQAASSTVTMDWDAASNGWWAITAVPIVPAAASGTTYDLTMAVDPSRRRQHRPVGGSPLLSREHGGRHRSHRGGGLRVRPLVGSGLRQCQSHHRYHGRRPGGDGSLRG